MNWSKKNVLVTGGRGFLGEYLVKELRKKNVRNLILPSSKEYDLREKSNCKKITQDIDIVIHLAAKSDVAESVNNPEKTFDVNLKSVFRISQELAKIMIKQKSGVIINIGSISAVVALPNNPAYNASKAALVQLSKSMALDLGNYVDPRVGFALLIVGDSASNRL